MMNNTMNDFYRVTFGPAAEKKDFAHTPDGLREAWEFTYDVLLYMSNARPSLSNPNRLESDEPDGITDDERDVLGTYEDERYRLIHADEIAEDLYWDRRIAEARGQ